MNNATKAKIAEETVQDIVSGLQNMLNPDEYFRRNFDIHFGSSEKLRKNPNSERNSSTAEESDK